MKYLMFHTLPNHFI